MCFRYDAEKVNVVNDQEIAQPERNFHSENRGLEKNQNDIKVNKIDFKTQTNKNHNRSIALERSVI